MSRDRRTLASLAAIGAVALVARLAWLGARPAHFDEARVALRSLEYLHTGEWQYAPALHGPLLFHLQRRLFAVLGPTDVAMRLPVAVVGGLLPLAAWLYRDHLCDREVLALGGVWAAAPLFVYYGRVARNDLPSAAFALVALGFALRARATGRPRYALAVGAGIALSLGWKENALLYLACWAGAAAVLLARTERPIERLSARGARWSAGAGLAAVACLAALVPLFLPRGVAGASATDLARPSALPAVLGVALVDPARELVSLWVLDGGHSISRHAIYYGLETGIALLTATGVVGLASVGLLRERGETRPLVAFAALWAAASWLGYPLASDVMAGWTVLHVVVPLTIPAAVGLAAFLARARDDRRSLALLGVVCAYAVVAPVAAHLETGHPHNPFSQPGQPENGLATAVEGVVAAGHGHPGTDVAYVGRYYAAHPLYRASLRWYLEPAGLTARGVSGPTALASLDAPPPAVVTTDRHAAALSRTLSGYVCRRVSVRPWGLVVDGRRLGTVVYVRASRLPVDARGWRAPADCVPGQGK